MIRVAFLGSGSIRVSPLPDLLASSATGLDVARWADKPVRLARMDRLCAIALVACDGALVDAGLSPADAGWKPESWGIVLGSAFGSHATNEAFYRSVRSTDGASPRLFAYTLPSSPVGEIAIHHRILGPSSTTVSGLAAGIDAFREALRHLDAHRAAHMLVAAADVATPMLERLGYLASDDTAAALVLTQIEPTHEVTTASRFVAGDSNAAAREVIAALRGSTEDELYASESILPMLAQTFVKVHALAATAAAPFSALQTIGRSSTRTALVVAADPCGQVSALRLERSA